MNRHIAPFVRIIFSQIDSYTLSQVLCSQHKLKFLILDGERKTELSFFDIQINAYSVYFALLALFNLHPTCSPI